MIYAYKLNSGFFTYRHEVERVRRRSENKSRLAASTDRRASEQASRKVLFSGTEAAP